MNTPDKQEAVFFGKITAGITHEINNVLAIIRESSGLMSDYLGMSSPEEFQHHGRFQKGLSTVQDQVSRGVNLVNLLNRLAHCPDNERVELELGEQIGLIVSLCQRFARQKKISLEALSSSEPVVKLIDPLKLQMALFSGIETCLEILPPGGSIKISSRHVDENPAVLFHYEGKSDKQDNIPEKLDGLSSWLSLNNHAAELGGRIDVSVDSGEFLMILAGE